MADHDQPALVVAQELAQPDDRVGVEVVGGLVEQQRLGAGEQDPGQLDAAALATGQRLAAAGRGSGPRCRGCGRSGRLGLGGVPTAGVQLGVGPLVAAHRPVRAPPGRRCPSRARPPQPAYDVVEAARGQDPVAGEHLGVAGARVLRAGSRPRRCACTVPAAGSASPARILVSVVLPAPLRPTRPTLSPAATRKLTSSISRRAPARTSSWWAVIMSCRVVYVACGPQTSSEATGSTGGPMRFNPKADDRAAAGPATSRRRAAVAACADPTAASPAAGSAASS